MANLQTTKLTGSLHISSSGYAASDSASLSTVEGYSGNLFSVSDDLSDIIYSVNTIAGLPVIEAYSDNSVYIGKYGSYDIAVTGSKVGIGTSNPQAKLHVTSSVRLDVPTVGSDTSLTHSVYIKINVNGTDYWIPGYVV